MKSKKSSHNDSSIAIFYHNLMKGYNRNIRPYMPYGTTDKVYSDILLLSVGPLVDEKFEFSLSAFFRLRWHDPGKMSKVLLYNTNFQTI